ncbi:anti-sigma factor family protein [Paralcaligenes ureilyticus]|uniref:Anti-sigma factor RsiW n=1 Tax=Paralcaligenes ureilyticus TaxID=627131 RepID=A0A4R3M2G5_9BURK|nr:anti-sigma factor [Paralcaligenes ureilyticus]TCT05325.1 anti-sigma factor RsiW [Paralcaligenes ureilyticus]
MSLLPITEAELQAFIEDVLPEPRRVDLEVYLAAHPAEAERLRALREQKLALKALYDPILDEPIPARLQIAASGPARVSQRWLPASLPRVAASLALVAAGAAAGWMGRGATDPGSLDMQASDSTSTRVQMASLARYAAMAHQVYSPEVRHPVEVGVDQEDQLVKWLSKRLGSTLRPPKLKPLGYELMGGRLLPGSNGPVAQFMYEDAAKHRLTLYVSTENTANKNTGFRFAREGSINVFYWIDGKCGYALSADIDKAQLTQLATAVYEQLEPS